MERIAIYLEKLGYTIEEQGSIARYLVIFKSGVPVGFIMPDHTMSLVNKEAEASLSEVIKFVTENLNLELVAGAEYLVATYKGSKLTTYYDVEQNLVSYASYIVDKNGEIETQLYFDLYTATIDFATKSQMLNPHDIKHSGIGFKDNLINKIVKFLLTKKSA